MCRQDKRFKFLVHGVLILCIASLSFSSSVLASDLEDSRRFARTLSDAFSEVAKQITPSVVNITAVRKITNTYGPANDPFFEQFRRFFGDRFPAPQMPNKFAQQGFGSGVVVDFKGHILTNNHVVGEADEITVQLNDKRSFKAELVGTDPKSDLAVIKIDAEDLTPAKLGNSDDLNIGEWVVAAGAPFGLNNTITSGIVSAKGRAISGGGNYEDFIQTDAAINPGNSGGPLVNLDGEVVGINTAIFSRSGGYMGIGFAIPSNMASSVMQSLIKTGRVVRGWLGVGIQMLTEDLAESFNFESTRGVLVGDVQPGSPAEDGGMKQGDIIIEFDGNAIDDVNLLRNTVAATKPGRRVNVTVVRNQREKNLRIKIGELPSQSDAESIVSSNSSGPAQNLGITVDRLTPELQRRLRTDQKEGMVITGVQPGSLADSAGLRVGDIILRINNINIRSHSDMQKAINKKALKQGIRMIVESQDMQRFVFIKGQD